MAEERKISPAVIILPLAFGLAAIGVVAALALAKPPEEELPPEEPAPGKANLYGKVTDASTGDPIAGVLVTLDGMQAQTNSSGNYQFINLGPGGYSFRFEKEGYQSFTSSVTLVEGNYELNVQMVPIPAGPARFAYMAMTPENLLAVGNPLPDLRYFIENDLTDPFFNDGWAWGNDIAVKEYPCIGHCIIQNVGGEAGTFDLVLEEKVSYLDWRPSQHSDVLTATLQPGEARLFSIWRYNYVGWSQLVRFSAAWGYTEIVAAPDTSEPEG